MKGMNLTDYCNVQEIGTHVYTHIHKRWKVARCDWASPIYYKFGARAQGCTFHSVSESVAALSMGCHSGSTGSCHTSCS